MKTIYLYCVATGQGSGAVNDSTPGGDVLGYALAEDGKGLCSHLSSNSEFSKHDMGLNSKWKHEFYSKKYPDGYKLEWIDEKDLDGHEKFQLALKINLQGPTPPHDKS